MPGIGEAFFADTSILSTEMWEGLSDRRRCGPPLQETILGSQSRVGIKGGLELVQGQLAQVPLAQKLTLCFKSIRAVLDSLFGLQR